MKKNIKIGIGFFVIFVVALLISFNTIFRENTDWDFIQKVGGIKIETPLETEDGVYLPVICNVSGLDSITIKPTILNSALSCIKIKSQVNDNTVHLIVVAGIGISKRDNCKCKAVNLGYLEPGDYKVYYGDKSSYINLIGSFNINRN